MRAPLTAFLVLLASGCSCSDDCAGLACDACPPAIQVDVRAPTGSDAPTVTGPVELACDPRPSGWLCYASRASVGAYTFEIGLGAESRDVTVELREGGDGCCSCPTSSEVAQVDFGGGAPDAGGDDAGPTSRDAAAGDAGAADASIEDGGPPDDAGAAACAPELVEFPMGGALEPGTLCDDVFACVPAAAVASVEATTVFDCARGAGESCAAGEVSCAYADPGGPSVLDEDEVAHICALTVHAPPPGRVVCRVHL